MERWLAAGDAVPGPLGFSAFRQRHGTRGRRRHTECSVAHVPGPWRRSGLDPKRDASRLGTLASQQSPILHHGAFSVPTIGGCGRRPSPAGRTPVRPARKPQRGLGSTELVARPRGSRRAEVRPQPEPSLAPRRQERQEDTTTMAVRRETRGRRRPLLTTNRLFLSCFWPKATNPRGLGTASPRTTEVRTNRISRKTFPDSPASAA
jgi:hypothetical protein